MAPAFQRPMTVKLLALALFVPLIGTGCTSTSSESARTNTAFAPLATVPRRPQPGIGCGPNGYLAGDLCFPEVNDNR